MKFRILKGHAGLTPQRFGKREKSRLSGNGQTTSDTLNEKWLSLTLCMKFLLKPAAIPPGVH